ncbi:hypothetical protein MED121_18410 [Marinomonas sp. MED121]|nr:hypothetical protein MED121_18410 [Marinomonas sp. MED121]
MEITQTKGAINQFYMRGALATTHLYKMHKGRLNLFSYLIFNQ